MGEGNRWYSRNKEQLGKRDPVCDLLESAMIVPKHVLEIGCANGWRLHKMAKDYGCRIAGIDASLNAIDDAKGSGLEDVAWGDCSQLPWMGGQVDMIIFGFCLYVTDPRSWLKIAAEADRLLMDCGWLVIHDFSDVDPPHARQYEHCDGVKSYHFDFAKLWKGHPSYTPVYRRIIQDEQVSILLKTENNIPVLR